MAAIYQYYERICGSKNRFEAADLIRANAAYQAATLICYNAEQRLSIVEQAEQQAGALERDFAESPEDAPVEESDHPFRRWLREWGYQDTPE